MASSSTSWMPLVGKYPVAVGSSLGRALKARNNKGDAPPPAPSGKRGIPTKDYFSFRYNFQPPSVDSNKQGMIEIEKSGEVGIGKMQKASTQPGEGHQFKVLETPTREYDCVVIFDEETMSFTLEKLDSTLQVTYEHKIAGPRTPTPPANPSPPQALNFEAELERELLGEDDADGEVDDGTNEVIPTSVALREEEEEGEMEEEIIIPPPPPKPKPRKSAVPPPGKPRQPAKAAPPPAKAAPLPPAPPVAAPLPPKPKPKPKPVPVPRAKKPKREPSPVPPPSQSLVDADEEDLQFGRLTKRARHSPPAEGLALPGVSTSIYTPPPPVSAPSGTTGGKRLANLPPPPPALPSESEEEEEWDEVVDVTKDDDAEDDFDIFGDAAAASGGGEEIDVNAFEMELNMQMEESDDDFLAAAVSPEPDDEPVRGMPISLNQLAAGVNGAAGYASEDEYSSSDESDDD